MREDEGSPPEFVAATAAPEIQERQMAAAYGMRPLSTGEVLDRTFSIYRSRFWLFAGIAAISGAVQLIANAINLAEGHVVMTRYGFATQTIESWIGSIVGGLLFLLATSVTQAATVHALSEVYQGRETTVGTSVRATVGMWYRYVGIALWQAWSAVWLTLLLGVPAMLLFLSRHRSVAMGGVLLFLAVIGGGIYGAIAYLRNSVGVQAAVVERSGVRSSMRRSKTLTAGAKGKIFVVLLVTVALSWVGGAIQMPMAFLIIRSPLHPHGLAQGLMLAVSFVTHTLVSPVAMIGLTLVYFDQRVRREALDLMLLLGSDAGTTFASAAVEMGGYGAKAGVLEGQDGAV